jgi:hypothetical protein
MSHTQHFLVSAYGSRWRKVDLIMLTVYVDDSGTDPNHQVAIASALIFPAAKIEALDAEWERFKAEESFTYLHAAEMACSDRRGQFKTWDNEKASRVFERARNFATDYGIGAFSMAIYKPHFDALVPKEWLEPGGSNHYTWAFRTLMHYLLRWHQAHVGARGRVYEFVIDNAVGKDRYEIEMMMEQFEAEYPGCFVNHYSFRCKANVPCLQLADLVAWSSFSFSKTLFQQADANAFAVDSMGHFGVLHPNGWLKYLAITGEELKVAIETDLKDADGMARRSAWYKWWLAKFEQNKTRRPPRSKCPC